MKQFTYRICYLIIARKLLFFCVLFCLNIGISQTVPYKNYSIKDGLPSSEVYNVMQDSRGYMWFCTDGGVCRFDGYEFKIFTTANGLPNNNVYEAKEDYKGRIWFRTLSGKLSYYYHDSIFKLPINDSLNKLLKNVQITSLFVDSLDNIYLGLHGFVRSLKISIKDHYSFSSIPLIKYHAHDICLLPSGGIINGVYHKPDSIIAPSKWMGMLVYKVDANGKATQVLSADTTHSGPQAHDKAVKLGNGEILASLYSKLVVIDSLHKSYSSTTLTGEILNIIPHKKNEAWIISNGNAPEYFQNGKLTSLPELLFLKDKHISSLFVDAYGGMWFTSLTNGVYYVSTLTYKTYNTENGLPGNKIITMAVAPDSSLWLAAFLNNKIAILYKGSFASLTLPAISDLSVNKILFHSDNNVWVDATNALYVFDRYSPTKLIKDEQLSGYNTLLNKDGTVWLQRPLSVYLIKRTGGSFEIKKDLNLGYTIIKTCLDDYGNLWISTANGLYEYTKDSLKYLGNLNPLLKKRFMDLKIARDGTLWLCNYGDGLIIKTKNNFYTITMQNGLLSNLCRCISQDYNGNFWIGTSQGLAYIVLDKNPSRDFKIKSIQNLHLPNLIEVNCIYCKKNTVYVGTNNGLTEFNMNEIKTDTLPVPIYITMIKVNDKQIPNSGPINLNHDENYIMLKYVGLEYSNPGRVNYRYKLAGIDTDWIYTSNTSVQYPKLPAGNYKFLVSAQNDDGMWNPHPASFSFIISPPIWATWWARTLYVLAIVGIGYYWIRTVQQREKRKTEINKQLMAAELRELKSQFDPHFLFNSLNTLAYLVEDKSDDAPDFVYELSKFYRYSLQFRENELMELEKEIKQAKSYIHLIKIRFGDQFKDEWNIDEKYNNYLIPTYSLQLLVENVTKHNIINREKPLTVEITTTANGLLMVKNKLQPRMGDVASTGHGLDSINERYKLLTGKEITITKTSDYFCVTLPLIPGNYESVNR